MILEILDPKNTIDNNFLSWLESKIRNKLISSIDRNKLKNWDIFINSNPVYKSIYKKNISTLDILISGANNLISSRSSESIQITINPKIYAVGFDRVKIRSLCKLINFGNRDISAYPIFTNTFKYFAENIQTYIDRYLYGIF